MRIYKYNAENKKIFEIFCEDKSARDKKESATKVKMGERERVCLSEGYEGEENRFLY